MGADRKWPNRSRKDKGERRRRTRTRRRGRKRLIDEEKDGGKDEDGWRRKQ